MPPIHNRPVLQRNWEALTIIICRTALLRAAIPHKKRSDISLKTQQWHRFLSCKLHVVRHVSWLDVDDCRLFVSVCDVADLPPRQPSDGYQVLDDVHGQPSAGTSSSLDHHSRHQHHSDQQQQQQPGVSSTSGSEDSSSEFGNM